MQSSTSLANAAMVNLVLKSMMIKISKNRFGVCGKMVNMFDYGAEFSLPSGHNNNKDVNASLRLYKT